MKKFTLTALAALVAASSALAQAGSYEQTRQEQRASVQTLRSSGQSALRQSVRQQHRSLPDMQQLRLQKGLQRAPRKVQGDVIYDQPAGKYYDLKVNGQAIGYGWGYYYTTLENFPEAVVEGTDGYIYIKNLPSQEGSNTWVKAERAGGDTIVIHKQKFDEYLYYGEYINYYIAKAKLVIVEEDGEQYISYEEADEGETDIRLLYKDGTFKTIDETYTLSTGYPDFAIGSFEEYEGRSYWDGLDFDLTSEVQTEVYTTLPADAQPEQLVLKYRNSGSDYAGLVDVAFAGDKIYFHPYSTVPGWFVGTISGNTVTVDGGQYVGPDSRYGYYAYLHTADASEEEAYDDYYEEYYTEDVFHKKDQLEFSYDADTKTLSAPGSALTLDGDKDLIYNTLVSYSSPVFYKFVEVEAVPADPAVSYYDYDANYQETVVDFDVYTLDVDGNYITPDKLSYVVYFDNDAFTFTADEYDLETDLDEVPYSFDNGYDITQYYGAREIVAYFEPAENVGVQAVYRGAGVEHKSNIVFYDIASGDTFKIDLEGNVITGLKGVTPAGTKTVTGEAWYDATGRQVTAASKGFVIKTLTFADGSKKSYKVVRKN